MNAPRKIKAVAIAKDEAAYLHEWVFHHLYFGFDGVEVLVNRTTDNSIIVLESLLRIFDNFTFSSCDWIDLCAPAINIKMQEIAYAHACQKAMLEGYTHVLFIDIDEFWTPKDFKMGVHEFLDVSNLDGSVSFNWVCELGQGLAFQPLSQKLDYFLSTHLKTLAKLDDVKEVRIHTPEFIEGASHILANGQPFRRAVNAPQFHDEDIGRLYDAFIIHRLYRSEVEYLAVLVRGNPDSKTRGGGSDFKLNRHGYNFNQGQNLTLTLPIDAVTAYHSKLQAVLADQVIADRVNSARNIVLQRYQYCVETASGYEYSNNRLVQQLFYGCTIEPLARMLNDSRKIEYSIDVVKFEKGLLTVSGWAFSKWARSELRFGFSGFDNLRAPSWKRSDRPDVTRVKPWMPIGSGFDLRLEVAPLSPNSVVLEIYEADLIQVFHGTYLLYDMEQQAICHGRVESLRARSWLVPIYFSQNFGLDILTVLLNHRPSPLVYTSGKVKPVNASDSPNPNSLFIKTAHVTDSFAIKCGAHYAGAAPGTDFYFNRATVQDWELFKQVPNLHEPRAAVEISLTS